MYWKSIRFQEYNLKCRIFFLCFHYASSSLQAYHSEIVCNIKNNTKGKQNWRYSQHIEYQRAISDHNWIQGIDSGTIFIETKQKFNKSANLELMELENIVANTVYLKAREGIFFSLVIFVVLFQYHCTLTPLKQSHLWMSLI